MIQSENITELLVALEAVQSELPTMPKNTPAYGYKYADLDTITQAIKPILHKHGIAYLQTIGGVSQEQMTLTTRVFNTKGQYIEDTAFLPVITSTKNNAAQTLGMSITYMRRYALCAMLGITSDEDTDANSAVPDKGQKADTKQPRAPNEPQVKGGESTPQEKQEIANLLASIRQDGSAVFTMDDKKAYSAMRKDKTAQELIAYIKQELQKRVTAENSNAPQDLY